MNKRIFVIGTPGSIVKAADQDDDFSPESDIFENNYPNSVYHNINPMKNGVVVNCNSKGSTVING
ncbi:hypothetical protein [Lapidilactobacillus salsurivasis]